MTAVFFDDNADNIKGAQAVGITSIQVTDKSTLPDYFAKQPHVPVTSCRETHCTTLGMCKLLWERIDQDNMTTLAGNLAYVSLPSGAAGRRGVRLLRCVSVLSDVSIQLRHFIFANFMPATGDIIQYAILSSSLPIPTKMTVVGACGLIATAPLLM